MLWDRITCCCQTLVESHKYVESKLLQPGNVPPLVTLKDQVQNYSCFKPLYARQECSLRVC